MLVPCMDWLAWTSLDYSSRRIGGTEPGPPSAAQAGRLARWAFGGTAWDETRGREVTAEHQTLRLRYVYTLWSARTLGPARRGASLTRRLDLFLIQLLGQYQS